VFEVIVLSTLAAVVWSILAAFGSGMRSSPGKFQGGGTIAARRGLLLPSLWLVWRSGRKTSDVNRGGTRLPSVA
jgi:hypothetical protein